MNRRKLKTALALSALFIAALLAEALAFSAFFARHFRPVVPTKLIRASAHVDGHDIHVEFYRMFRRKRPIFMRLVGNGKVSLYAGRPVDSKNTERWFAVSLTTARYRSWVSDLPDDFLRQDPYLNCNPESDDFGESILNGGIDAGWILDYAEGDGSGAMTYIGNTNSGLRIHMKMMHDGEWWF